MARRYNGYVRRVPEHYDDNEGRVVPLAWVVSVYEAGRNDDARPVQFRGDTWEDAVAAAKREFPTLTICTD
jgi:hypothetical protein